MTEGDRKRQRSLYCRPEEQAAIREKAAAADKTLSRYLLDLWRADDPDRHVVALTAAEQEELRGGVREVRAFARALRRELPGGMGQCFTRPSLVPGGVPQGEHRQGL